MRRSYSCPRCPGAEEADRGAGVRPLGRLRWHALCQPLSLIVIDQSRRHEVDVASAVLPFGPPLSWSALLWSRHPATVARGVRAPYRWRTADTS